MGVNKDLGASTGSRASTEPVSRLGPAGFDPERRRCGCGCFGEEDCALNYGGGCRWTGGYTTTFSARPWPVVVNRSTVADWLRGEEAQAEAVAVLFEVPDISEETFGEMARKVCEQLAYMVEHRANLASAIEAQRAATGNTDAVHESATSKAGDAQ